MWWVGGAGTSQGEGGGGDGYIPLMPRVVWDIPRAKVKEVLKIWCGWGLCRHCELVCFN